MEVTLNCIVINTGSLYSNISDADNSNGFDFDKNVDWVPLCIICACRFSDVIISFGD